VTDEQKKAIEQLRSTVAPAPPPAPQPPPRTKPAPSAFFPTVPVNAGTGERDLEQWFGQRGLLAVGVAALLIAAALFLKYAFDRGWIPPLVRSVGAVVAGIAVAAWGHERIGRGMRRYGAAMIGAGGGLIYLGLWAAAGPYALMERRVGILLLAATTVAVTVLALHHEIEGLAIWALGGAYLAPIVLATEPNPLGFLSYLEIIGLGTGITAYAMGWRTTFNLALFGYLLLAAAGAAPALSTPPGCWLLAAGALLTLHVTRQRDWPEARLGVVLLAWGMLGSGLGGVSAATPARWLALSAALPVLGLIWWHHLQRDPFGAEPDRTKELGDVAIERLLFIANPLVFIVFAAVIDIPLLNQHLEIVPAALTAAYLPVGWVRRSTANLVMGFLLAGLAMAFAWDAWIVTVGWTVLAAVALMTERNAGRPGGRAAAVTLMTAAWVWLFSVALFDRDYPLHGAAIFADHWALALSVFAIGSAATARWWGREGMRLVAMWTLCGSALFLGGSIELRRYFSELTPLAGDLALSVWWLLFAGALVLLGFRLNQKLVRSTGLAVAAMVALKIVLYDLAALRALYRVGSFLVLAIIALAVAYAYNRKARADQRA
jgi:uncharacterized membrane protein